MLQRLKKERWRDDVTVLYDGHQEISGVVGHEMGVLVCIFMKYLLCAEF